MNRPAPNATKSVSYLPMTNGQKWCMSEMLKIDRPGWYNIEFLIKTKVTMNEAALEETLRHLVNKYESLRIRIVSRDGQLVQEVYPLFEAEPFAIHDFSDGLVDRPTKIEKVKQVCIRERDELLPMRGNLVRVLFFKFSETEGRLWFCMHHMVSDFVSVLIFSSEFMRTYNSIILRSELKWHTLLDYRKWLYILEGYSRDVLLPAELGYWLSLPWYNAKILPSDFPEKFHSDSIIINAIHKKEILDSYTDTFCWLDHETSLRLFNKSGADFEDILIAVFFLAVSGEKNMEWLDINVCNAGRNILAHDYEINVNQLLGFLATTRALLLTRPLSAESWSAIQQVIEQIRNVPNRGLGFTLIGSYITDNDIKQLYDNCRAKGEIFFNYLGRVNTGFSNEQYETVEEDVGLDLHNIEVRNNILDCEIGIKQNRLFIKMCYPDVYFSAVTIAAIMQSMINMFQQIVQRSNNA